MCRFHSDCHGTRRAQTLTWDMVLRREPAIWRMRSVSGSMPGKMLRNSSPRGPAGRLSLSYFPVSMPAEQNNFRFLDSSRDLHICMLVVGAETQMEVPASEQPPPGG